MDCKCSSRLFKQRPKPHKFLPRHDNGDDAVEVNEDNAAHLGLYFGRKLTNRDGRSLQGLAASQRLARKVQSFQRPPALARSTLTGTNSHNIGGLNL